MSDHDQGWHRFVVAAFLIGILLLVMALLMMALASGR